MVMAVNNAIRQNELENNISVEKRDLVKKLLTKDELKKFDAVVINPPRDGAAYVAAKHGIAGLTKVVGLEVAQDNITCNAILMRFARAMYGFH